MSMKVTKDYGNGISVEVEGDIKEVIKALASTDEIFMDMRAVAQIDGKWYESTKVGFGYREVGKFKYYEQVCMDNSKEGRALNGYKRSLGQHQEGETLFVKKDIPEGHVAGAYGWHKYVKPVGTAS